jgi:6-phosphogluconolactonase
MWVSFTQGEEMNSTARVVLSVLVALSVAFPTLSQGDTFHGKPSEFAVFVMTNSAETNEIIAFNRTSDGGLQQGRTFSTGGRGSGGVTDPLESQGSLTFSEDRQFLFAANSGSGDVTVFRVNGSELSRIDRLPSGGSGPNAVTQHGNLVFVLNAGGGSNVTGFHLEPNGKLKQIENSTGFLTINNPRAGSLSISPDGRILLVTEKSTNNLDAFRINQDGTLTPAVVTPSAGPGLFAVIFAPNGVAIATETGPAGGINASAVSSYAVAANGALVTISASVPTNGAATCWQVVTPNGHFVYSSNSATATISGFAIGIDGSLTPLPGTVVATLASGSINLDVAISSDGEYLYSLNSGTGTVSTFHINQDGTLTSMGDTSGLKAAAGLNGIAAL